MKSAPKVEEGIKVLDKFNCYERVTQAQVDAVIADPYAIPEVHHLNAIYEFGMQKLDLYVDRALKSPDQETQAGASRVAVKAKLFQFADVIRELAQKQTGGIRKELMTGDAMYLSEPFRGLQHVLDRDEYALYVLATFLSVESYDEQDIDFCIEAFLSLVKDTDRKMDRKYKENWVESMMPNAINSLDGAAVAPQFASVASKYAPELLTAIEKLRASRPFKGVPKYTKEELASIEAEVRKLV